MRPRCSAVLLALLLLPALPSAQTFAPLTLAQMSARAGLIFAGTVITSEYLPGPVPQRRTTFLVRHGVRGARAGESVTIREWAPAWDNAGYRVGQRLFLILHAPGPAGLTSPVGGRVGSFSADGDWNIVLRPEQASLGSEVRARTGRQPARNRVRYRDFVGAMRGREAR